MTLGKPKPEKKKKSTKKRRITPAIRLKYEEADRIVKKILVIRDGMTCVCPEPKSGHSHIMQNGHLITRGKKSVRWDLWNTHLQCSSCNLLHEHQPERFTKWFIEEFGINRWMDLVERSSILWKPTEKNMDQVIAGLNSILIKLQTSQNLDKEEYYLSQRQIINIGKIVVPD